MHQKQTFDAQSKPSPDAAAARPKQTGALPPSDEADWVEHFAVAEEPSQPPRGNGGAVQAAAAVAGQSENACDAGSKDCSTLSDAEALLVENFVFHTPDADETKLDTVSPGPHQVGTQPRRGSAALPAPPAHTAAERTTLLYRAVYVIAYLASWPFALCAELAQKTASGDTATDTPIA